MRTIGSICGLVFIIGCTMGNITSPSRPPLSLSKYQENQVIYSTIKYIGVIEDADGNRKITFELTNPREISICVTKSERSGYFGEIDYINAQQESYKKNTVTVVHLSAQLDALASSSTYQFIIVPPNKTLRIERDISQGMFPHGNGLFTENGPFYAQLEIDAVFECIAEDVSEGLSAYQRSRAMEEGNFVFLSGKVGPFYLQ